MTDRENRKPHELMRASPIVTIQTVSEKLGISFPTAGVAGSMHTRDT